MQKNLQQDNSLGALKYLFRLAVVLKKVGEVGRAGNPACINIFAFMKKIILLLSFLLLMDTCFSQVPSVNKNQDVGKVYASPQIPASFPGGELAWQNFVAANLDTNVPLKNGAQAGTYTVSVRFIVGMDSVVSDVGCENDPQYGMCQEAIRLIRKSGKWKPATQNGRIVNGFKLQPIVFTIK